MTPITDKKAAPRILRITECSDSAEPFQLIDDTGKQLRMDANPKRLADWGLEFGQADFVRHDYDLTAYERASFAAGRLR